MVGVIVARLVNETKGDAYPEGPRFRIAMPVSRCRWGCR